MLVSDLSRRKFAALGFAGLIVSPANSQAPAWPTRQVKFLIPFGAGTGSDIGARIISEKLQRRWKHPVIIENRPGADGLLALGAFMQANDDHVLMFGGSGSFTVHPYQYDNLRYDFARDVLPIARYSSTIIVIAVPTASGINTLKEFVAKARANPGKLNAALVPGISELVWDGFVKTEQLDVAKVPYKDIVTATNDLGEGRLDVIFASYAVVRPAVETGKVRALAVTSRERVPLLPNIPSSIEEGVPSLELEGLVGLFGPKIMSQDLRDKIGADVVAETNDPTIAERLGATGQVANSGGAVEFEASIRKQMAQVKAIADLVGMKPK